MMKDFRSKRSSRASVNSEDRGAQMRGGPGSRGISCLFNLVVPTTYVHT